MNTDREARYVKPLEQEKFNYYHMSFKPSISELIHMAIEK